jgi:hypothetical protein
MQSCQSLKVKRRSERVLAIAKGEIKPKPSDPKIWFTYEKSVLKTLFKNCTKTP